MTICKEVGHNLRVLFDNKRYIKEKCADCGFEKTWDRHWRGMEAEYGEAHKRDWIQPNDPLWKVAYPDKKTFYTEQEIKELKKKDMRIKGERVETQTRTGIVV